MDMEEIRQEILQMEKESKALKKEIYQLAWFMRGSLSIEQAFLMDISDGEIIRSIVKENIEITEKTKLPFF